jgi:RHS repeat-associated protein
MDESYAYWSNSNVRVVTNNLDNTRTATYAFDNLNRISTASSQATSGANCWGQSYGYDRYGNLTAINSTQCSSPTMSVTVNAKNQVTNSGFVYDNGGNLTSDGPHTYTWNGENRLASTGGVTYTYDGDGKRVQKSNGTIYWYDLSGNVLEETDASGNRLSAYIYFGGKRVGRYDPSGAHYAYLSDLIGSSVVVTDSLGHIQNSSDYYPFGGERHVTNNLPDHYKFTGMERDGESGLDHTLYRQFTSTYGRWLSPDPECFGCTNPQKLNRYAYVLNNPVTLTDPLGLDPQDDPTFNLPPVTVSAPYPGDGATVGPGLDFGEMLFWGFGGGAGGHFAPLVDSGPDMGDGGGTHGLLQVTGLQKSGPKYNRVASRLDDIVSGIDPDCLKFLQSGGNNLGSFVSDLLSNNLLAVANFDTAIAAFTGTKGTTVAPGDAAIVVNNNSAFFSSDFTTDQGNLTGGTPGAQAFILLHELGHALSATGFKPDLKDKNAGEANDKLIEKNCNKTLKEFDQ